MATVGALFREDGLGLRDDYKISGPELETMCDIVRTVPGVYGERMLGGGDKGASGALVAAGSVEAVRQAVEQAYPRSRPAYADRHRRPRLQSRRRHRHSGRAFVTARAEGPARGKERIGPKGRAALSPGLLNHPLADQVWYNSGCRGVSDA